MPLAWDQARERISVSTNRTPTAEFDAEDLSRIFIHAREGNDSIALDVDLPVSAFIDAGPGNDRVSSGPGSDTIFAGPGNDHVSGGAGDDFIDGGAGNDRLIGNSGRDELHGGPGNDRLEAADGDDILVGGAGNDKLKGGTEFELSAGGSQAQVPPAAQLALAAWSPVDPHRAWLIDASRDGAAAAIARDRAAALAARSLGERPRSEEEEPSPAKSSDTKDLLFADEELISEILLPVGSLRGLAS